MIHFWVGPGDGDSDSPRGSVGVCNVSVSCDGTDMVGRLMHVVPYTTIVWGSLRLTPIKGLNPEISYRTESENADDGKAKSRDSRATNCGAGTRDQ